MVKDVEIEECDWADYWALDIEPTCPRSGRRHHQWEGTLFVATHECFGRLCAENFDQASFAGLDIDGPGRHTITWTSHDGYADWAMVEDAGQPVPA
jgi:hypothetical protein